MLKHAQDQYCPHSLRYIAASPPRRDSRGSVPEIVLSIDKKNDPLECQLANRPLESIIEKVLGGFLANIVRFVWVAGEGYL
jgi:hypothetical protein